MAFGEGAPINSKPKDAPPPGIEVGKITPSDMGGLPTYENLENAISAAHGARKEEAGLEEALAWLRKKMGMKEKGSGEASTH